MSKEELFSGINDTQSFTQKYLGFSFAKFFILLFAVIGFGIYIGLLLYGDNSLQVYMGLVEYENHLQTEIERLKNENAELQREYFELKEISAK
ncbi:MAG: bZIP transcription factor [Sulfurimonas sp.]|uniref:FtsB family cell division protein n=1 Tax=Sulfurimonas sp. TaxID=2022749 RepID=UPI002610EA82|nr:bZIP transcription factor [Sulfurimonas sp.]MDD2653216.1 bZIP transcription factor [Sulfurimonas sp.]MDD3452541.1 bZIP transcription factor [Sulfurimonas sp.]